VVQESIHPLCGRKNNLPGSQLAGIHGHSSVDMSDEREHSFDAGLGASLLSSVQLEAEVEVLDGWE